MVSAFDAVKYERLMNGLEAVEMRLSEVVKENIFLRLDSDFFKKEYLHLEHVLRSKSFFKFDDSNVDILHPSEIQRNFVEEKEGTWFFRTQNLRPLSIESSNDVYISKTDAAKLKKNNIKNGDVLVTRTGANFGDSSIYLSENIAIASSHVFIIRNKVVNQYFLAVFYNTRYGRSLINKGMYGGAQPELAPYYLKNIPVPNFTKDFQREIEALINYSSDLINQSKKLNQNAEHKLLDELGLHNWKPTEANTEVKTFQNSFLQSGRLDAEYYQPKYDELVEKLEATGRSVSLGSLLTYNQRGTQPVYTDTDTGLPVLNSKHIRKNRIDFIDNRNAYKEEASSSSIIKYGDVLINGTGVGTIGRTAPYLQRTASLPDNHVTILRSDVIDPVFLSVMLNSVIGSMQVDKYFKGSSGQIELYPSDINEFIVWNAPKPVQDSIRNYIEEANQLEQQSQHLLNIAKQAVEIAIEQSEEAATAFIKNNTQ